MLLAGLELDHDRLAVACADPLLLATDAAEALVLEGVPFREAHERVAAQVRDGTFEPPAEPGGRPTPGPGGAREQVAAARATALLAASEKP